MTDDERLSYIAVIIALIALRPLTASVRHPRRIYLVFTALAFGVCLTATAFAPDVAVACLVAAGVAALVHTPPHPDAALTDIDQNRG